MVTINFGGHYKIASEGNGAFITITRVHDDASVFLQGDDASDFLERLDDANDVYTVDDVCAEYDNVMQLPVEEN